MRVDGWPVATVWIGVVVEDDRRGRGCRRRRDRDGHGGVGGIVEEKDGGSEGSVSFHVDLVTLAWGFETLSTEVSTAKRYNILARNATFPSRGQGMRRVFSAITSAERDGYEGWRVRRTSTMSAMTTPSAQRLADVEYTLLLPPRSLR